MKEMGKKTLWGSLLAMALILDASAADRPLARFEATTPQNTALPAGVVLVEMKRFYNAGVIQFWSGREMPDNWDRIGWQEQGTVGFVSYYPFTGGHALYNCFIAGGNDYFTSPDPNCEGKNLSSWWPILGYVASTQLPGTVPLYRCMRGGLTNPKNRAAHFDTTDPNCENVPNKARDGVIGYVFL